MAFAPTPITIRYGNPTALGGLAAAAGSAGFNLENNRITSDRAYQDYVRQQGYAQQNRQADREFLLQNAQIAAQDQWRQNDAAAAAYTPNYDDTPNPTGMQDAAGYGRSINPNAVQAKTIAQKTGNIGQPANTLVQLVPDEGPINAPSQNPSYMDQGGVRTEMYRDKPISYNPTDTATRDALRAEADRQAAGQSTLVTPDVRQKLDYVKTLQGTIPEDQWNAMWVEAHSSVPMDKLADDARQSIPKPPGAGPMGAEARNMDKYRADMDEISQVLAMPPVDQAAYARHKFGMQDPDIYSDQDAIVSLQSRARQLKAITTPTVNSSGKSLTGGNVVPAPKSAQEYALIPQGAWYVNPSTGKPTQKK